MAHETQLAPVMTCPPPRTDAVGARADGAFGQPELRSFACTQCREAVTIETGETQTRQWALRSAVSPFRTSYRP